MLRKETLAAWMVAMAAAGCSSGQIMNNPPSLNRDIVRYEGVYFVSADGLKSFERVTVVPRLCTVETVIQPKTGPAIPARDITMDYFKQNGRTTEIFNDEGDGTFLVKVEFGLTVKFENHRPVTVSVDCPNLLEEEKHFALLFKGKEIRMPLRRTALEELLGTPDEVARNSATPIR
jgi:hypothetical protein